MTFIRHGLEQGILDNAVFQSIIGANSTILRMLPDRSAECLNGSKFARKTHPSDQIHRRMTKPGVVGADGNIPPAPNKKGRIS